MNKIQVLIVDDHGVVRAGLRALVEAQPDMEVVDEVGSGEGAMRLAREYAPDIVIMDVELPGMSGIQAASGIRQTCPRTRVLALSMYDEEGLVQAMMHAGAAGYVVKDALGEELMTAIRAVHAGRSYINASLGTGPNDGEDQQEGSISHEKLSDREQQVLELLALGYTNQEIGKQLNVSHKTVGPYRRRLNEKLGLYTRADIVHFALRAGLLTPTSGLKERE